MKPISPSSDKSPTPDSGVTDSLWQPSWWRWLISALSGTVETEKQIAWLRKSNEELRKNNEELKKSNEDARIAHEQRMHELRKSTEELRQKNKRLAELESKLNEILHS